MKFLNLNLPLFVATSAYCSINVECQTSKTVVLEKFTEETTELFKKLPEIQSCGKEHLSSTGFYPFDYNGYKNCISHLGLPEEYESKIANFLSSAFNNNIDFRESIKYAAFKVCSDLNFDNFTVSNDIPFKSYKVTGLYSSDDFKKPSKSSGNYKPFSSNNEPPSNLKSATDYSVPIILFIGFFGCIILLSAIIAGFIKFNRKNIPDKLRDGSESAAQINIYPDHYPNAAQPAGHGHTQTQSIPPILSLSSSNEAAPPPYHEVGQGYPSIPPTRAEKGPY